MSSVQYRLQGRTATDIADSAEEGVRRGALGAGDLLPTVRRLATELQVAPGTVAAAYRSLRERGLVQSDGRRGTRVRARPAVAARVPAPLPLAPGAVDLSLGQPDPALLPSLGPALARLEAGTAASPSSVLLPELLEAAQERFGRDGVPGEAVTVTSGALDGIERVLSAHLRRGDAVAVEDPGWPNLLDLVAGLGLRVEPVALDEDGPLPASLARALRSGARAVVITSRAQNPTGAAVTPDRADALRLVLAAAQGTLLVEDDHGGDLADVPLASLAGTTTRWAFVRSLSKPYGPDLRVALLSGDATTVSRVEGRLRLGPGWVSSLLQRLAADLLTDPSVDLVVAGAARAYAQRRGGLVAALAERGVPATGRTGINVWVPVPDETAAVTRLVAAGWLVTPGSRFRSASAPGVRVGVSAVTMVDLPRLADAITASIAGGPRPVYTA